ncbi:protein FAR1-RELATED SEQUENCE 5-like [Apium graveolens]|uniref:protein FAR1-RELATED SEQUENCE 5-like n=1 Tax=Apium graveolens TaxID=4045 RepID=UPI003D79B74A
MSDKVIHNVVNSEVVDVSGSCLRNDNVDYVNLVDNCDEDIFVSEQRFENEDLHENSEFMHDSSETKDKSVVEEENIVIPFLSQNFPNLVAAENVIRAYALKNGFAIKIQNTQRRVDKTIYARTYVCNLAGENRDKEPVEDEEILIVSVGSAKKKMRGDKLPRSGCKFRIYVINRRNTRHWEITSLELNHNHEVVSSSKMSLIKMERHTTNYNIFGKMHGGEEQLGFHAQHLRNVVRDFRKDNLGVNDAQAGLDLLHRLEEESGGSFFIRTLIDEEGRLKCLLWVDPRSLLAYKNFGDVVAFDTTYRINRYAMSFVPFTEVNHHYQSVLFGFTLMRDELKTTFEWVLGTRLEAIEGKAPLAIITDQDQVMTGEIQSQLPNTTHLLCLWAH